MNGFTESAEDLAEQNEIEYGTLEGGSTMAFFRVSSTIPRHYRILHGEPTTHLHHDLRQGELAMHLHHGLLLGELNNSLR